MPAPHDHNFLHEAHDRNARRTRWVLLLSFAMMVAEIVAGTLSGSMALTADGWHMATHTLAIGASALAYWLAKRWANDPRFTFGTGKLGSLAGFASALFLVAVALGIAWESAVRLMAPRSVDYREAILVAVLGLVVNLVSAALLHGGGGHGRGHDHGHEHDHDPGHAHAHGHAHEDHNLRSAYVHVLSDALTSVLAIVALAAGLLGGWRFLDPLVGVLGAVMILRWSVGLIRDTSAVLLDQDPDPELSAELRHQIESPGDADVTDLHLWQVGPGRFAAILSVRTNAAADAIRARVHGDSRIAHLTVECG